MSQTRDALDRNRDALLHVRTAFFDGVPSEDRLDTRDVLWENALLRAQVHAGQQVLLQLQAQMVDLAAVCRDQQWSGDKTAPWIAELSSIAASSASEHAKSLAQVQASGGTTSSDADRGKRSNGYLAELVPSLMRHSTTLMGQLLRDTKEVVARHRAERERLVVRLREGGAPAAKDVNVATPVGGEVENVPPQASPLPKTSSAAQPALTVLCSPDVDDPERIHLTESPLSQELPPRQILTSGSRAVPKARREGSMDRIERMLRGMGNRLSLGLSKQHSSGSNKASSPVPLAPTERV